jgi:hypothetical protein
MTVNNNKKCTSQMKSLGEQDRKLLQGVNQSSEIVQKMILHTDVFPGSSGSVLMMSRIEVPQKMMRRQPRCLTPGTVKKR